MDDDGINILNTLKLPQDLIIASVAEEKAIIAAAIWRIQCTWKHLGKPLRRYTTAVGIKTVNEMSIEVP